MKKLIKQTSVMMILVYIMAQFLPLLFIAFTPEKFITEASIYGTLFSFTAGAIAMIVLNHKSSIRNSLTVASPLPLKKVIQWGLLGVPLLLLAQYAATIIEITVLGISPSSANTQNIFLIVENYPVYIVLVSIMGPIMEEFIFRKVIFGSLYDITGGVGAAVISSLIFAFMHFDSHLLLYSSMAFVFCFLYTKTKSIATPIIAHILMNTAAILLNFL